MRLLQTAFWLLALLAVTGLALMFLYVPQAAAAPGPVAPPGVTASVITPGGVMRGVHFWAAQLFVLAALLNFARVLSFKRNRARAGWALALLVLTGLLWFTGMLLPWDQLGRWMAWTHWDTQDNLLAVYWTHAVLFVPILIVLILYLRRMRSDLTTLF